MANRYIVQPAVSGSIVLGSEGHKEKILIGRRAEHNHTDDVWIGADQEFVALVVGKRGSGKSYTLGNIVEGFATGSPQTAISSHQRRRAVLLLDPMGNFWTMHNPVSAAGPDKVKQQFDAAQEWGLGAENIAVDIWLPAGFRTSNDPVYVREFSIMVPDLEAADLADLIGVNLVKDPQGAALADAYEAVAQLGWNSANGPIPPNPNFALVDLINYLDELRQQGGGDHSLSTLKAVIRSLRNLTRMSVFSSIGTAMNQLLIEGRLAVLMLPHRVGSDLRKVITRLILRRTLREREEASQIRQRLSVEALSNQDRVSLENELRNRIPRTLLALDEAQELLGDEGGEARHAIEDFCLLGRNYGLSLVIATQRPGGGAISSKVRSQADIQLIHRLLTQDDIDVAKQNLLGVYPEEVRAGDRALDFANLVRDLERGQMIISSSNVYANERVSRIIIAQSRPRVTVHGGEVE